MVPDALHAKQAFSSLPGPVGSIGFAETSAAFIGSFRVSFSSPHPATTIESPIKAIHMKFLKWLTMCGDYAFSRQVSRCGIVIHPARHSLVSINSTE
jgi:hypothetical protein